MTMTVKWLLVVQLYLSYNKARNSTDWMRRAAKIVRARPRGDRTERNPHRKGHGA
jgi:hypothetical protein